MFEGTLEFLGSQLLSDFPRHVYTDIIISCIRNLKIYLNFSRRHPDSLNNKEKDLTMRFFQEDTHSPQNDKLAEKYPVFSFCIRRPNDSFPGPDNTGKSRGKLGEYHVPAGFVLLYVCISEIKWKKFIKITVLSTGFISAVFISFLILYPSNLKTFGISVKPENNRTNEVKGWDVLGKEIAATLKNLPGGIFCLE